jgi:hypothetical protein
MYDLTLAINCNETMGGKVTYNTAYEINATVYISQGYPHLYVEHIPIICFIHELNNTLHDLLQIR